MQSRLQSQKQLHSTSQESARSIRVVRVDLREERIRWDAQYCTAAAVKFGYHTEFERSAERMSLQFCAVNLPHEELCLQMAAQS